MANPKSGKITAQTDKQRSTTLVKAAYQYEYIAVAGALNTETNSITAKIKNFGGPNPGSALMFVNQAMRSIRGFPNEPGARTLAVFREGYDAEMLGKFQQAANANHARLIVLDSVSALLGYLNHRTEKPIGGMTCMGQYCSPDEPREDHPIKQLTVFAHGVVGAVEFGYESAQADNYRLTIPGVTTVKEASFAHDAEVFLYSCRAGLGNPKIYAGRTDSELLLEDQSLAQKFANAIQRPVSGYMVRTDYTETLKTKEERDLISAHSGGSWTESEWVPQKIRSTPSAEEIKLREKAKQLERKTNESQVFVGPHNYMFMPNGALHPVKPGNTPLNVPTNYVKHLPKKPEKKK
jgi:hypothetical protein